MSDVDPTGAARTAEPELDETERTLEQRGERDMLDLIRRVRRLQHAATLSHLAGQAGPEVRGLVDAFAASCRAFQVNTSESPLATIAEEEAWSSRRARIIERMNAAEAALLAAYDALRQQRLWCSVCNDQLDGKADICEVCAQTLRQQAETSRAVELAALEEYGKVEAECAALRQQRDEAERVHGIEQAAIGRLSRVMHDPAVEWKTDTGTIGQAVIDFAVGRIKQLQAEAASERQRADKAEVELAAARKRYPADIKDLSAELEWGEDYDR